MSGGDSGKSKQKSSTSIMEALIGAVAIIVAAVIGVLASRPATGPSNMGSAAPPSTSRGIASVCVPVDRRYEVARLNQSPSAAEIGVIPAAAYFFLDRATSPPEINASGRARR